MDKDMANEKLLNDMRSRAEEILRHRPEYIQDIPSDNNERLIHELGVYQVELEMQNEELRRAQIEINDLLNKYFELYELAPVGYFTLDKNGMILEANSPPI